MTRQVPIGTALTALAVEAPDAAALTVGDRTITRGELDARSNQLARAFAAEGAALGDLVTIVLPNSVEFVLAAVACWKIGAVPQPVSSRLPGRELEAIVELADSALVVGAVPEAVPGRHSWPAGRRADPSLSSEPLPPAVSPTWKAPTSGGSTGRPKLILSGDAGWVPTEIRYGMQPGGCVFVPGPLYHNAPFIWASLGLFCGSHVVLLPKFEPEATLAAIDTYRPQTALLVPTMMIRILRLAPEVRARYDLSSLREIWHMGSPCPEWAKRAWLDWVGPEVVWELYAGTESQAVTTVRGDDWLQHPGTVGRVTTGEMRVVDPESQHALPAGQIGEIVMRRAAGTPVTYRYVGAEPRLLGEGWESLGDMGWFDEDGYLHLADRRADMILSGGANIYPAEIEAALQEHPAVDTCAVVGLPHDELGQSVHAVLHGGPGTIAPGDDELSAFVSERLVRYKVPRSYEWVDHPLRDDAGKVRRSSLRDERKSP